MDQPGVAQSTFLTIKKMVAQSGPTLTELQEAFPQFHITYLSKLRKKAITELTAEGVRPLPPKPRSYGPRSFCEQPAKSNLHVRIGLLLNHHRESLGLSSVEMAPRTGIASHIRLRQMELGLHDFTLTELMTISRMIGKPLTELMEEPTVIRKPSTKPSSLSIAIG